MDILDRFKGFTISDSTDYGYASGNESQELKVEESCRQFYRYQNNKRISNNARNGKFIT